MLEAEGAIETTYIAYINTDSKAKEEKSTMGTYDAPDTHPSRKPWHVCNRCSLGICDSYRHLDRGFAAKREYPWLMDKASGPSSNKGWDD